MILTFYRHIIKSFILQTCAKITLIAVSASTELSLCWATGCAHVKKSCRARLWYLPAKGQAVPPGVQSRERAEQYGMSHKCAHGKMGLLGNNRNNVTRPDEPSACL